MRVDAAELVRVALPLWRPLLAAHGFEHERRLLLVRVMTDEGEGWGECPALVAPTYVADHRAGAELVLAEHFLPAVLAAADVTSVTLDEVCPLVGHPTARAALHTALLDVELRRDDRSLASHLGVTATTTPVGVVLGLGRIDEVVAAAEAAVASGVVRCKLKIAPGDDLDRLLAVRAVVGPSTRLHADANAAYDLDDADALARLAEADLELIEQPLAADALLDHARLATQITTPIALDESIDSVRRALDAVALGAASSVSNKPARLGGLDRSVALDEALEPTAGTAWMGGWWESGVGRTPLVVLAARPGRQIIGDVGPTGAYLAADLVEPLILTDGRLTVPTAPGAVPTPDRAALARHVESRRTLRAPRPAAGR